MKLCRILETSLYAQNLDQAEDFYTRLLGHEPYQREPQRHVFFKLDEAMLLLFNPETTSGGSEGIPSHGARGQGHVCFRIEEDQMEAWKWRLAGLGIPIEVEHTWPNGSKSLYFRDPAGNSIELAPWRIWTQND
jgi:catechol 2,3-dioxygenase-like lactoylglutathione lyase family enzyme